MSTELNQTTDPIRIIKEEVGFLVRASLHGPGRLQGDIPVDWSAVGAEYRIRMALNQLEKRS